MTMRRDGSERNTFDFLVAEEALGIVHHHGEGVELTLGLESGQAGVAAFELLFKFLHLCSFEGRRTRLRS